MLYKLNQYDFSIVMAYFNRKEQLMLTLKNFEKNYKSYSFEVIIVDDASNNKNNLEGIEQEFSFPMQVYKISKEEKNDRKNPCIPYNIGFQKSRGNVIIIQNPECFHIGDLLGYVKDNLNNNNYITFSCFSPNSHNFTKRVLKNPKLIYNKNFLKENEKIFPVQWFNHPTIRRTYYHFCSAITQQNLKFLGGFDERFQYGISCDDDELIHRIKFNLRLSPVVVYPEVGFVIHQFHGTERRKIPLEVKTKVDFNQNLMTNIYRNSKQIPFPKILHTYWDGSNMSFLHYTTFLSFIKYHPDWTVIIHQPLFRTDEKTWNTTENTRQYTGDNYFQKLSKHSQINFNIVDFNELGFFNTVSEIIKSDFLRYYMLYTFGGVWADTDIIFLKNIELIIKTTKQNIVVKYNDEKHRSSVYTIGFLCAKKKSLLFKMLLQKCKQYYNPKSYQSIGSPLLSLILEENPNIKDSCLVLTQNSYLPISYHNLDELYNKNVDIPGDSFGIHWYNGHDKSKEYQNKCILNSNTCTIDKYVKLYK